MAKFHEKALCLFNKDYKQLKKEAERRGMRHEGREKTIANIIWKDAYDAGFNEGKDIAVTVARRCPENCHGNAKPEVTEYCFYDMCNGTQYRLELTEEQVRVFNWMLDNGFLTDVEFSKWSKSFKDVGRI